MSTPISAIRVNKNWVIYAGILIGSIIIASLFPITNDESYYIAFSKHLQLSYVDAPPFVAYLNVIQVKLGLTSPLYTRALVIALHLLSTLFLLAIVRNHCTYDDDLASKILITFLLAYLIPIFGLFGIFILPDCGLILSLSILLWAADTIIRTNNLRWKDAVILGIGLGVGLLAKYHILPLGGGILLGLFIELSLRSKFSWYNVTKLLFSVSIALLCALPLFIWNVEYHFASFRFQLEHGFSSTHWQLSSLLLFILGSIVYLTPWFSFILLKRGLFLKKHWYLFIPVGSLLIILLASSLRKNVLPHWISPAFWLLIPYSVIYSKRKLGQLNSLMTLCKMTALIWVGLIGVLLLPGGLMNIKQVSLMFNSDARVFKDLLLWQELPNLLKKNISINHTIDNALQQKQNPRCSTKKPIIATLRWFWAAQLEYHGLFPGTKIINLDQHSSNFYLWRDRWSDYAYCNILVIGEAHNRNVSTLAKIISIRHQYTSHGLGDYRSLNVQLIDATLKDSTTLQKVQSTLISHPHY